MRLSTSRLIASLFALLMASSLTAQLQICLSVHGGPALGFDNFGAPSQLKAVIAGNSTTIPLVMGQTAAAASAAHEAAFAAGGYATVRAAPNLFYVTALPGGMPVVAGAAYGTTDPMLGLDCGVVPIPGGQLPNPGSKRNGVIVPVPQVGLPPLPFGATLIVYVKFRVLGVLVTVCVPIDLFAGQPAVAMQQDMQQQFAQQGFLGHLVTIPDPFDALVPLDMLQLERTGAGEPIEAVEIQWDPNSLLLLPHVTGAGLTPIFGCWEYGLPTQGIAPQEPFSLCFGQPQVGGFFDIVHEMHMPLAIGINALSLQPSAAPVFNGILLVDPLQMVLELGITDPLGGMQHAWPVPPDPALAGFELVSQGVVLAPGGQHVFSTGMGVRIKP